MHALIKRIQENYNVSILEKLCKEKKASAK